MPGADLADWRAVAQEREAKLRRKLAAAQRQRDGGELMAALLAGVLVLELDTLSKWRRTFPLVDLDRLDESWRTFERSATALVQQNRARAAGLASSYMRAAALERGTPSRALVKIALPASQAKLSTSLRVTGNVAAKVALAKTGSRDVALARTFSRSYGAGSRHVSDGARETVMRSSAADPNVDGWHRVASPSACTFCRVIAERDELYRTTTTGDFGAHDDCDCLAEPVFVGGELGEAHKVRSYTPSMRDETPSFSRASQRDYLAT